MNTQEAPSRIGSYRIDGVLARGAFGVVYRAAGPSGAPLALKTLHALGDGQIESLRREVHLLTQLRHPGVVSVLDSGVDEGIPWYAMELIEGGTLAGVFATRPPLDRALRLVARLCEPLAFLHGEGIVHRDMKPANVVVRDGDEPVIVDFGLISQFEGASGREAVQVGGELAGTVAYMSPEQVRADFVDARSDLYALGCMLYEAVVGEPPFRGRPSDVLYHHLNRTPRRPSEMVPHLPPSLDELVMRLLAKDPRDRPGYTEDVRRLLNQVNGDPDAPFGPQIRRYLYRPSFVGRARPMEEVTRALRRAESGTGSFLMVSGESGVGKTRFAMEAARLATHRRFDVVTATCSVVDVQSEARVEAPLAPLRPLLRAIVDRCLTEGQATVERLLGRRAKVLATYEPALRQVPGFDAQPEAPPLPPDADRERTLADMMEALDLYMAGRPLLLVIDDVQWADDLTIALLTMLRDGLVQRHPLVILTACRSEEQRPGVDQLLASAQVQAIQIARLNPETVKVIVSDMLAMPDPPWALVRLLERDSQGNPFFVGEYLRGAVEAGFLSRSTNGSWAFEATDHIRDPIRGTLPISSSLRNVILRRLAALDDVTRDFVEAGAMIGREFQLDFAAELAGISPGHRVSAAATLVRRQILETTPGDRLRFAHDKLREIAYEGIAATRKVTLHRRAAEAMERADAQGDASIDFSAAALAHHWLGAGDKAKSSGYFGIAGRRALETGAYADAHLYLVKALTIDDECGGSAGRFSRTQWRRMLAVASYGIGDLEASLRHATDSLVSLGEWAPRTSRGWFGLGVVEALRRIVQRTASLRERGREARAPAEDVAAEAALASAQLATSYFHRAATVATIANLLRSLNRSERSGIDALIVDSSSHVAYVAAASGLRALADRHFRRAEQVGRRGTTPRELGVSLYLRAQDATGQGQWERAHAFAQEAIALLDEIGDRSEAEVARAIAAHAHFYSAQFDTADDLLNEMARSAQDRAHEQHVAWARFLLGRTQLALGRSAEALPLLAEARPILVRLQDILSLSMCEGLMSLALWKEGHHAEARDLVEALVVRLDEGMRARVPHTLDAYAGLLEYLFEAGRQEARASRPDASRVHRYLRGHSRIFPIARPLTYRTRGWQEWMAGDRSRAVRSWRKAVRSAMRLGMWHEAALAHQQLARFSTDATEAERSSAIADGVLSALRTTGHAAGAS